MPRTQRKLARKHPKRTLKQKRGKKHGTKKGHRLHKKVNRRKTMRGGDGNNNNMSLSSLTSSIKPVLVFDFDKTLHDGHTGGSDMSRIMYNNKMGTVLNMLKERGYTIYMNTRAYENKVFNALQGNNNLGNDLFNEKNIYGANSEKGFELGTGKYKNNDRGLNEISSLKLNNQITMYVKDFKNSDYFKNSDIMNKIIHVQKRKRLDGAEDRAHAEIRWAAIKYYYLTLIADEHPNLPIYFFDDCPTNVDMANIMASKYNLKIKAYQQGVTNVDETNTSYNYDEIAGINSGKTIELLETLFPNDTKIKSNTVPQNSTIKSLHGVTTGSSNNNNNNEPLPPDPPELVRKRELARKLEWENEFEHGRMGYSLENNYSDEFKKIKQRYISGEITDIPAAIIEIEKKEQELKNKQPISVMPIHESTPTRTQKSRPDLPKRNTVTRKAKSSINTLTPLKTKIVQLHTDIDNLKKQIKTNPKNKKLQKELNAKENQLIAVEKIFKEKGGQINLNNIASTFNQNAANADEPPPVPPRSSLRQGFVRAR